jgi:hypothetical protein
MAGPQVTSAQTELRFDWRPICDSHRAASQSSLTKPRLTQPIDQTVRRPPATKRLAETAPLILVGASSLINKDPNSIFSFFTALPIQIYNWTSRPQVEFRNIAAAAILVLLIMLLSLNSVAIILRNRLSRRNT